MTENVIISEVDTLLYLVPRKGKKKTSYGKVVGAAECITL